MVKIYKSRNNTYSAGQDMSTTMIGPNTPKLIKSLIVNSHGLLKNERQAGQALILFAIIALTISLFVFVFGINRQIKANIDPATGKEIIPGQINGEI